MYIMDNLEAKFTKTSGLEQGDISTSSAALIEERVNNLNTSQKAIIQLVIKLSEDVKVALDLVRAKMMELSARVNLTIRAVRSQTPTRGAIQLNKIKILEPKLFCGVRDAKVLENFIFNLE